MEQDFDQLAEQFQLVFAGLERAHGEYQIPPGTVPGDNGKLKGKAKTLPTPVTRALWLKHLSGEVGLGIVPIREDGTCMWGAIDLDIYDDFDHTALEKKVLALGLPLLVCRTKSGGCHLFLFASEPIKAPLLRKKLREFEMALGYVNSEIFPKQDRIEAESDFGSWVNMPYYKALFTTRYAFEGGKAVSAARFLELASMVAVTSDELEAVVPEVGSDEFSDAPPCIQHLTQVGFPQGSRNNALLSMGVYARKKFPETWEEKVFEYNQRFMSPGTYAEVKGIIRSLSKKGYEYKCNDQPLCSVCNKIECRKRQYGVGGGREEKGMGPCILDDVDRPIKRFMPPPGSNDEPHYVFTIGGKDFDVTVDMILDQRKFLRMYFIKCHRLMMPIKDLRWTAIINDLTSEAEEVELPADAGPEGQFWLHLEQFCLGKVQARAQDELLLGKPWTDDGKTYFRSKDLMKYLDQQHFREYKEKQIWAILRRRGLKNHKIMLRGRCVGCWSVDAFTSQTEDFEKPLIGGQEDF